MVRCGLSSWYNSQNQVNSAQRRISNLLACYLLVPFYIFAQDISINNVIATDIQASGDDVLEIDFEDYLPNVPFVLAWIAADGEQFGLPLSTKSEKMHISLGEQKGWNGEIALVGISITNVSATIRKSNLNDEFSAFLNVLPLSPAKVNFANNSYLFGLPYRWICAGSGLLFFLLIYALKRRWRLALIIAIFIGCSLYDVRSSYNRWSILNTLSQTDWKIPVLEDLQTFIPQAREIIGTEGSWTKEPLSGFLNAYCTYSLADLTYYPSQSPDIKKAQFVITTKPRRRKVVLREGPFYLIRRKR